MTSSGLTSFFFFIFLNLNSKLGPAYASLCDNSKAQALQKFVYRDEQGLQEREGKHQCQATGSKMHDAGEFACATCLKLLICGTSHKTSFWRNSRMSGEPFIFFSLRGNADNEQKSLATWLAMLSSSTPPSHKRLFILSSDSFYVVAEPFNQSW